MGLTNQVSHAHSRYDSFHKDVPLDLFAEPLALHSGVIWTALSIDYPGHSFSHLGIFYGEFLLLRFYDLMNIIVHRGAQWSFTKPRFAEQFQRDL